MGYRAKRKIGEPGERSAVWGREGKKVACVAGGFVRAGVKRLGD